MSYYISGGWQSPDGKRYAWNIVAVNGEDYDDAYPVCLETGEVDKSVLKCSYESLRERGWVYFKGDAERNLYLRKAYWFSDWCRRKLNVPYDSESVTVEMPMDVLRELVESLRRVMAIVGDRYIPAKNEYLISDGQVWSIHPDDDGCREIFEMFDPSSLFVPLAINNWIARDMKETLEWCERVFSRIDAGEVESVWFHEN